jgi:hypothetical protein
MVSALTGVSEKVVGQAQDAAQYLENYTRLADAVAKSGATDALLAIYALARQTLPPDQAAAKLFGGGLDPTSPDPKWPFSAMARTLMKLVLLGVWYHPNSKKPDDGGIPTAASYSESLVWLIAQAHPVGYALQGHNDWTTTPPPLNQLIG